MFVLFLQSTPDTTSLPYWLVALVVTGLVGVILYQERTKAKLLEERRLEQEARRLQAIEDTKATLTTAEAIRATAEASKAQTDALTRTVALLEQLGGLEK